MGCARLTRRDWIRLLLAAPIAATLDVERLLWVPKPIVVVPAMPIWLDEINAMTMRMYLPGIKDMYFGFSPFLEALKTPGIYVPCPRS